MEHTVTWLSKCCAILMRYDKKESNYIGLIQLGLRPALVAPSTATPSLEIVA